jgi:hypothetical protein
VPQPTREALGLGAGGAGGSPADTSTDTSTGTETWTGVCLKAVDFFVGGLVFDEEDADEGEEDAGLAARVKRLASGSFFACCKTFHFNDYVCNGLQMVCRCARRN